MEEREGEVGWDGLTVPMWSGSMRGGRVAESNLEPSRGWREENPIRNTPHLTNSTPSDTRHAVCSRKNLTSVAL